MMTIICLRPAGLQPARPAFGRQPAGQPRVVLLADAEPMINGANY